MMRALALLLGWLTTSRVMGVLFELGESSYDESIGFASWVV
jgi:hypothetical protein